MRTVSVVIALALLSACAPPRQMVKPGSTPEQANKDQLECQYESEKATASIVNPWDKAFSKADIKERCLQVRGYVWR